MESVTKLLEIYGKLNESNRFAVLVYARMKVALQMAAEVKPYIQQRRRSDTKRGAHWAGLGA